MKLLKKEREKIKKNLPSGWKRRIAQELDLQEETVRHIMGGRRNTQRVIKRAIEMSVLTEEEKSYLINKLQK